MSWVSSVLVVSPALHCDAIMKEVVTAEKRPAKVGMISISPYSWNGRHQLTGQLALVSRIGLVPPSLPSASKSTGKANIASHHAPLTPNPALNLPRSSFRTGASTTVTSTPEW
ncbi:hypothetical protein EDB19DRAFT_1757325 [Suillus lakei]|nr:hypothetical protein EDB19DRAFT_1757162 [Suillus lakei]KAG1725212.1 hypothetical protein EDB19DRAFT_1757325 [Suillus lakei]